MKNSSEMMTEMDDPMVLESLLAARSREKKEALLKVGVFENSVVDSPASGATKVTGQVVGMETLPPAPTLSSLGDDMSKPGDGAQSEAGLEEEPPLATKPSEKGIAGELPFESVSISSPNSGTFKGVAGEGTAVAQKKRRSRGKKWVKKDTDDLLGAVSNTTKASIRMEEGTGSDPYWDVIAKAVPGRTGQECRGRMDTLKRSFSTTKNYCDGQRKEFNQLTDKDFGKLKVSPRLTEARYNQIRDHCPPRPKKKLKTNGAGSSSKSTGFVPDSSTLDLLPSVLGEPVLVASGPTTPVPLPMGDPPAFVQLQLADQRLHQHAPPLPRIADDAEDSIESLLASFVPQIADDAEDFIKNLFASFVPQITDDAEDFIENLSASFARLQIADDAEDFIENVFASFEQVG